MNKLDNFFGKNRFMAHVYYGDPDKEFSHRLIKQMIDSGIDILELGIPFSDPQVDGETFQKACIRALAGKTTPIDVLKSIGKIRKYNENIPIVITTYYNVILQYGIEKFVNELKQRNVQGIIVPDIVLEEAGDLIKSCEENEVYFIFIITPYTNEERMKKILSIAKGFVYLMRTSNVTGAEVVDNLTKQKIEQIKSIKNIPVMTGFGISDTKISKKMIGYGSDGVIIGSAIAKIYEKYIKDDKITDEEKCLNEVSDFIISIRDVL
ncbi:tryptophan synthase subunit alpha [archaeon]|jgi:tryptophan synthase alpha chain|nr:tryptophan synthase subunit alpha [archaeon]MBT4351071.1 tryptophan synthase subunit alpha [archaeon]MBT4648526.1 tryptophan synthase subunit alpha [archaeon]MBT6821345.1 tryptophan synthase subunit alpha [archaeon]MBT7391972.1 tryptophan synthase subunit alpha [archaeon]